MKTRTILIVGSITALTVSQLSAQELYRDEMTSWASWGVNANGSDYLAVFNYNYGGDGVPEAPNSQAGDVAVHGLKLQANLSSGSAQFFTVYPLGQNFTGSYQLRFDAWMNYGTNGTTEFLGGGIGYNNSDADLTSGAQAVATGDGGSSVDWRAFDNGTYYPLGNSSDATYADFLPSVNGSAAGAPGFQWITWEFNVIGGNVSIFIEKPDLSRLELTSFSPSATTDGNISLFYADFFASLGEPTSDTFGLVDNVIVRNLPEPTTAALALLGAAGLAVLRRRR